MKQLAIKRTLPARKEPYDFALLRPAMHITLTCAEFPEHYATLKRWRGQESYWAVTISQRQASTLAVRQASMLAVQEQVKYVSNVRLAWWWAYRFLRARVATLRAGYSTL